MKHVLASAMVLLGFGGAIVSQALSVAFASGPHVAMVEINDTIRPTSAGFLSRAIDTATDDGAMLLVIQLDTPGGLYSSTKDMVADILASEIPVVVYVSPSGAHAASAGTFVTAAAHVAAMAPATTIGAASPIAGSGENLPATIGRKATQDAAALIREIARARSRNVEALEQTVLNSRSYSASEALGKNVVDLVARNIEDLMAQLDGMTVILKPSVTEGAAPQGKSIVLRTIGLEIRDITQTPVERFLGFLADPNVAFLLLVLGGLGIFVEFLAPGMFVPGIAGVMTLALAFVALGNLPVNLAGVGLLALSMVLLFLELQAPGIGVFGIAGAISFVLGAFLLFGGFTPPPIETPSFKVNIWLILGVTTGMFAVLMFLVRDLLAARPAGARRATKESLVGQTAIATSDLVPHGTVHVGGEDWSAVSDSGEMIDEGEEVMVLEADGLTLKVFKSPLSNQKEEGALGEEPV